ncbi:hypothetical protein F4805DRAFT_446112 [Annulohypoxylon moriforme]|nr:hypothetical protein F4805DRAFT_446112 [Annulohypoxylon moriforme]
MMTEPEPGLSGSRDRGLGERYARYKRTRGGEDGGERGGKRVRREEEEDEHYYEERGSRRRSVSSRGEARERGHRSRDRYQHQHSGGDYMSQSKSKSKSTESSHRESKELSYPSRATEHSPSKSPSRRHHHSHHHHHHRHRHSSIHSSRTPDELPFGARPLVRSDLDAFRPLFAQYIEVQKNKDVMTMDEREVRGRWKSFVGKWNRGELAEGWYRAETLEEARKSGIGTGTYAHDAEWSNSNDSERKQSPSSHRRSPNHTHEEGERRAPGEHSDNSNSDSDSDSYGPTLPSNSSTTNTNTKHGPGIPSLQDLSLRRETAAEEKHQHIADLRHSRKLDRKQQRERLDELVPRPEAGTRERMLEKRKEVGDKMRAFREQSPGGGAEVGEAELMGGGDGVAEYKRLKKEAERRRTEREVRREEEERAREAEREERRREWRKREEGVLEGLRRIARERFG